VKLSLPKPRVAGEGQNEEQYTVPAKKESKKEQPKKDQPQEKQQSTQQSTQQQQQSKKKPDQKKTKKNKVLPLSDFIGDEGAGNRGGKRGGGGGDRRQDQNRRKAAPSSTPQLGEEHFPALVSSSAPAANPAASTPATDSIQVKS
jgi:hypothetical protein